MVKEGEGRHPFDLLNHPPRSHATPATLLSKHLDGSPSSSSLQLRANEGPHLFVPGNGAGVFPGSTSSSSGNTFPSTKSGPLGLLLDMEVPSALLYAIHSEEEEEALATEVRPGGTYVLLLDNFPPARLLALRLTGEKDDGAIGAVPPVLLGRVPAVGGGAVRWRWTVGEGTPPGEYFIEAAAQDAFAYSQAFRVVVSGGA